MSTKSSYLTIMTCHCFALKEVKNIKILISFSLSSRKDFWCYRKLRRYFPYCWCHVFCSVYTTFHCSSLQEKAADWMKNVLLPVSHEQTMHFYFTHTYSWPRVEFSLVHSSRTRVLTHMVNAHDSRAQLFFLSALHLHRRSAFQWGIFVF